MNPSPDDEPGPGPIRGGDIDTLGPATQPARRVDANPGDHGDSRQVDGISQGDSTFPGAGTKAIG